MRGAASHRAPGRLLFVSAASGVVAAAAAALEEESPGCSIHGQLLARLNFSGAERRNNHGCLPLLPVSARLFLTLTFFVEFDWLMRIIFAVKCSYRAHCVN